MGGKFAVFFEDRFLTLKNYNKGPYRKYLKITAAVIWGKIL